MPKARFKKAYYLNFLMKDIEAEFEAGEGDRRIQHLLRDDAQRKKDLGSGYEKRSIIFGEHHPRNSLPSNYVPHLLIPYIASAGKPNQRNILGLMKEFFSSCEPYSVIYIQAHGAVARSLFGNRLVDDQVIQVVRNNENGYTSHGIKIEYLAKLLNRSIPDRSKHHLKIHLLVCNGSKVAPNFMEALDGLDFENTSVIGYSDTVACFYLTGSYDVGDFSTVDRLNDSGALSHQSNSAAAPKENKVASHNYSGKVETISYKEFKETILRPAIISDQEEETEDRRMELLALMLAIEGSIRRYINKINVHEKKTGHVGRRHGKSGLARSEHLLNAMREIHLSALRFESGHSLRDIEISLIKEIRDLSAKAHAYRQIGLAGRMNVQDNSLLTYIFEAINAFYETHGALLKSYPLIQFGNYLLINRKSQVRPTRIYRSGENDEPERFIVKRRLEGLTDVLLDQL